MKWFPKRRWQLTENRILLLLALSVGAATSIGVWLFREGIELFQHLLHGGLVERLAESNPALHNLGIIAVLAGAGLIVGFVLDRFIGEERHHGVAGIMEAVAFNGGRLRYRRVPVKAALASFSIGAGASVGPEDPSVQIGANLGSMFGQGLRLSDERIKLLVAAGVAGGISAAFRAPIAGVFFALEIVLGDFSTRSFGAVVLTSVTAAVLTQAIEAKSAIFAKAATPELGSFSYTLRGLPELPLYIVLGILLAPISIAFIRMLYWQHDLWHHLKLSRPLKAMLAGTLVGVIAVFLPQIMGTGREVLNALLNSRTTGFTISLLLALVVAKMVGTTISLGGGFVGGMFAPSLFVGAAFGRAFGEIVGLVFPSVFTADPAAFAIAGMAAAMTGVIRSPITAVILLFELTNDYRLILPIMLTTAVCLLLVEKFAPDGIYHFGLARKGIRLVRGRDIDLMQTVTVSEAMVTTPLAIPASLPALQLDSQFELHNVQSLVVTDAAQHLYGIVTLQDLRRAAERDSLEIKTVADICTRDLITVTPDMPIAEALRRISTRDLKQLPVVASTDSQQLLGLLRRRDIINAYDLAIQRKVEAAHAISQAQLAYPKAHITELEIKPHSSAVGALVRDMQWPSECVIAIIRRTNQILVPRGETRLEAGDMLTIVASKPQHKELLRLLQ